MWALEHNERAGDTLETQLDKERDLNALFTTQMRIYLHRYYNGGLLLDEVAVDPVQPPPRPSTVPQALQQAMPLADVLNLIAKPPGSAPPFIPYKPVRW